MQIANRGMGFRIPQPDTAAFVTRVFLRASGAMLVAGASAVLVTANPRLWEVLYGPSAPTLAGWLVILAPLPLAYAVDRMVDGMSLAAARLALFVWSVAIGASLASLAHIYAGLDILAAFFGTAAGFALLALVGMSARSKLSRVGVFSVAGLVGILVATVANLLLRSEALDTILAGAGVLVFSGLAAFDIRRIERLYEGGLVSAEEEDRLAMVGALTLSLDFLNLLLSVLRLTSRRR